MKRSIDIHAAVESLKTLITHDGTYIVVDGEGRCASGATKTEARKTFLRHADPPVPNTGERS